MRQTHIRYEPRAESPQIERNMKQRGILNVIYEIQAGMMALRFAEKKREDALYSGTGTQSYTSLIEVILSKNGDQVAKVCIARDIYCGAVHSKQISQVQSPNSGTQLKRNYIQLLELLFKDMSGIFACINQCHRPV